jgi:hypothetical protein
MTENIPPLFELVASHFCGAEGHQMTERATHLRATADEIARDAGAVSFSALSQRLAASQVMHAIAISGELLKQIDPKTQKLMFASVAGAHFMAMDLVDGLRGSYDAETVARIIRGIYDIEVSAHP